jgi:hypothetical protein
MIGDAEQPLKSQQTVALPLHTQAYLRMKNPYSQQ